MLSGTSMAASHVAGYAAYLLTLDSALTPATVLATIKSQALKNTLTGIRKFRFKIHQRHTKLIIHLNSRRYYQPLALQRLWFSPAHGPTRDLLKKGL